MNRTKMEWADATWNPVVGCRGACPYCYARKMAARFHMTTDFAVPTWSERNFNRPFPRKPSRVFVNSMSDVADWQQGWTMAVRHRIWSDEGRAHLFLFLSKRPWDVWIGLPTKNENVMLGYSVTEYEDMRRLYDKGYENVSFLSIEPILGRVHLSFSWRWKWIIVGAETGNRRERVKPDPDWLKEIYLFATENKVPLFFKESLRPYWPFDGYDCFPQEFPAGFGCSRQPA